MQRARSLCNTSSDAANFRIPARYKFSKLLGSGSYGVVAAFYDSCRGREVAVKRVRRVFDNFLVLRRTLREIRLMRHFRHPNVLRLHKVLPLDGGGADLYLSLELMDCDLDTLIHARQVALSDHQVRRFCAQMLLGLLHMHCGHVLHRDLKPANVFVRLSRGQVKLGDFGLSRGVAVDGETGEATHPSDELLTEYVVTRWYRAPEVLLARSKYGPPMDVWSVGCILYEMWARKALFPGKNSYDQLRRVICVLGTPSETDTAWVPPESVPLLQRCCQPSSADELGIGVVAQIPDVPPAWSSLTALSTVSAAGADLLKLMCAFDPARRATIEGALQHQYLAGLASQADIDAARAVSPADVAYDRMFDGIGRSGEAAALVQLSRMLRREIARDRPADDATPNHSPSRSPREAKVAPTAKPYTPRGCLGVDDLAQSATPLRSARGVSSRSQPALVAGSSGSIRQAVSSCASARGSQQQRSATAAAMVAPVKRRASEPFGNRAVVEQPPPAFYELPVPEARRGGAGDDIQPPFWQVEVASSGLGPSMSAATLHGEPHDARRFVPRSASRQARLQRYQAPASAPKPRVEQAPPEGYHLGPCAAAAASPRASPPRLPFEDVLPPAPAAGSTARGVFLPGAPRGASSKALRDRSPTTATTRTPGSSKPASAQSTGGFVEPQGGSSKPASAQSSGGFVEPHCIGVRGFAPAPSSARASSGGASARKLHSSAQQLSRGLGSRIASARGATRSSGGRELSSERRQSLTASALGAGRDASSERRQATTSYDFQHDELDFAVCEPQVQAKRSVTPRRSLPLPTAAQYVAGRNGPHLSGPVQHTAKSAAAHGVHLYSAGRDESPTPPWMELRDAEAPAEHEGPQIQALPGVRGHMAWEPAKRKAGRLVGSADFVEPSKPWRNPHSSLPVAFDPGALRAHRSTRGATPRQALNGGGGGLGFAF